MLASYSVLLVFGRVDGRDYIFCTYIFTRRDQHKRLAALEMELAGAKHDGFSSKHTLEGNGTHYKKRPLAFIGIFTGFGGKKKRDAIRKQWFPTSKLSPFSLYL